MLYRDSLTLARLLFLIILPIIIESPIIRAQYPPIYTWLEAVHSGDNLVQRIPPPDGYERVPVDTGSFAEWLRYLPLKPEGTSVYLYNGEKKTNQSVHAAVIDIDCGTRDLQQCADAVIRLRAEYLYSKGRFADIRFNFTSGDTASYLRWREGYRPAVRGSNVRWAKTTAPDSTYKSFREYLDLVFTYAGTQSLEKELPKRTNIQELQIGDIFIQGGSPGHAVIAVDMARNKRTGEKIFLLAQSYMPAQDMHILKNPNSESLSPWYSTRIQGTLNTPEWFFSPIEIKYFPE